MSRWVLGLVGFLTGWLLGARRKQVQEAQRAAIDAVEVRAAPLVEEVSELREVANVLREGAAALDKQWGRVGREQFKANTLDESQQRQTQAALEQLRDLSARREADIAVLRDQLRADQSAQRLIVIQQLLPALDGLNEVLAAGERLLAKPAPEASAPVASPTLRQRIAFVLGRDTPSAFTSANDRGEWRESVVAWLEGIELVRARLLQLLAAEDVQPIDALGQMFDPYRHIAVETSAATDDIVPGTIVEEYRQGYQVGDRILRASEVVVAKELDSEIVQ